MTLAQDPQTGFLFRWGWAFNGRWTQKTWKMQGAQNVLDVIENEVLVAWDEGKTRWADFMRASIATSARFTGARMISDYLRFYDSFE